MTDLRIGKCAQVPLRPARGIIEDQLQILQLTTPELKKTFAAPFAQDDSL
jgi:hypothetical protein